MINNTLFIFFLNIFEFILKKMSIFVNQGFKISCMFKYFSNQANLKISFVFIRFWFFAFVILSG